MLEQEHFKDLRNEPWRKALRQKLKNKERISIPRVDMRELSQKNRIKNHNEVNLGFSQKEAILESKRCIDCLNPSCITGCPIGINIPHFIKNIERNNISEANKILKETSSLPAVCGRVCPQEKQCESKCIHLKIRNKSVAIGHLERFVADFGNRHKLTYIPTISVSNGIKIAIVGSGPAGLSFAWNMVQLGYKVTVFEALHEIGGVLRYGIPWFRLPKRILDIEIAFLKKAGVLFIKNIIVGKTISYDYLNKEGYLGIFIAGGSGLPNFMNIPGENLSGILSSNEYLTRINLMKANITGYDTPVFKGEKVAVIGGGNTAIDSIRIAVRLGAKKAILIYRRSEEEMPARKEEIKHAKEEGVQITTLYSPIKYVGNEKGYVKKIVLQKMKLGELDKDGRKKSIKVYGSNKTIEADVVIIAIGGSPNPIIQKSFHGLNLNKYGGTISVNDKTLQTNLPGVYAGGDIVRGGATVILAMGDGKRAARYMHQAISKKCFNQKLN